jgi:hypothetical protein
VKRVIATPPDQDDIIVELTAEEVAAREAEETVALAEIAATQYLRDREAELPSPAKQLEMIYLDRVNGTNAWEELLTTIYTKYPKP